MLVSDGMVLCPDTAWVLEGPRPFQDLFCDFRVVKPSKLNFTLFKLNRILILSHSF